MQLGEYSRVIQLDSSPQGSTEKEMLYEKIRAAFCGRIRGDDHLTLQKKDESWGGLFVDFLDDVIEDRSVFRVVVEMPMKVCELQWGLNVQYLLHVSRHS